MSRAFVKESDAAPRSCPIDRFRFDLAYGLVQQGGAHASCRQSFAPKPRRQVVVQFSIGVDWPCA
jgi:hypothetical protein